MLALIDGDIIRYSCGFASDAGAKAKGDTHEPLSFCLHSVDNMIESILDSVSATDYKIYLTGSTNYRDDVAVTKQYKGNRDTSHKPHWYKEIKEHLINYHGAIVTEGIEADDAIGIEQTTTRLAKEFYYGLGEDGYMSDGVWAEDPEETVICTIDKDLNMIEGWHYNWRKDDLYHVTSKEADRFFYTQLLTGDSVDNIQGVKGIGPKKAEKILKECKTEEEMVCAVGLQYAIAYDNPEDVMNEMAALLWIQREENKVWMLDGNTSL